MQSHLLESQKVGGIGEIINTFYRCRHKFFLAACSSCQMEFCIQDLLFSFQNLIGEKLFFYIFKSDSCNGICKTFSCVSLFTEEKNCFFHNIQNFLFGGKDFRKCLSLGNFLAPSSADVDLVARCTFFNGIKWSVSYTTTAVVADILINLQNAILHFCSFHWTCFFNLTFLTAIAHIFVKIRH